MIVSNLASYAYNNSNRHYWKHAPLTKTQYLIPLEGLPRIMSAIASTIVAHKFLVAIAIASLTITGGAIAVGTSANTVGTMSFTVNSSVGVVSIANMDFGNLTAGQSKTFTSTAKVNITSNGNYTLYLENTQILDNAFSSFDANVTGLSASTIMLSLDNPWARFNATSGVYDVTISLRLTVNSEIGHILTVNNSPFLGISTYPPSHIEPMPPIAPQHQEDNGQDIDGD